VNKTVDVIAGSGLDQKARKSHWPARLDFAQSASGLFLALFLWGHMAFVSTILIRTDTMWWVTKMFEGRFVFGRSYPGIVAAIVALVVVMFVLHGLLAMQKFPANFQEYRSFRSHRKMLRHEDTTLWWVQAVTGFALFFFASVHLYQMLLHPGDIGPYESADRVYSGRWWPLYLVLLFTGAKDYIDHPDTAARVGEIEALKKQLNGADRFTMQQKLMPYEHLLPERFRGKNERIDEMMAGTR
jgi:fumarate reductase subunit C